MQHVLKPKYFNEKSADIQEISNTEDKQKVLTNNMFHCSKLYTKTDPMCRRVMPTAVSDSFLHMEQSHVLNSICTLFRVNMQQFGFAN